MHTNNPPKRSRSPGYDAEIAKTICLRLVNRESLRSICADPRMPAKAAVCRWLARNQEFRRWYALARASQVQDFADEMLEIADECSAPAPRPGPPRTAAGPARFRRQCRDSATLARGPRGALQLSPIRRIMELRGDQASDQGRGNENNFNTSHGFGIGGRGRFCGSAAAHPRRFSGYVRFPGDRTACCNRRCKRRQRG